MTSNGRAVWGRFSGLNSRSKFGSTFRNCLCRETEQMFFLSLSPADTRHAKITALHYSLSIKLFTPRPPMPRVHWHLTLRRPLSAPPAGRINDVSGHQTPTSDTFWCLLSEFYSAEPERAGTADSVRITTFLPSQDVLLSVCQKGCEKLLNWFIRASADGWRKNPSNSEGTIRQKGLQNFKKINQGSASWDASTVYRCCGNLI